MASPTWRLLYSNNLFPLAFVVFLSTSSYLLGIYLHARGAAPRGGTLFLSTTTTCHHHTSLPSSPPLDFSLHHPADSLLLLLSTSTPTFPFCPPSLTDLTPCHDPKRALSFPRLKLAHRDRHCRTIDKCLVPAPDGYRIPFPWPESRDVVWLANVPHKHLAVDKAGQNWVRVDGDRFRFPGGGTMFPGGADKYIDEIAKVVPLSGGAVRTAVDTGCGVASFGAYMMSRNVTTVSFAPRDSHEAQVQFALERGVPALIGVLATDRLPYPARAFDLAHCSRCLVPWHLYDGQYLAEIDRILQPGGYWVLSGPPINWKNHWKGWERKPEDLKAEQTAIEGITESLCWKKLKQKGDIAVWQKPFDHMKCRESKRDNPTMPFCSEHDPDKAWYTELGTCITPIPEEVSGKKLKKWPERIMAVPPRISTGTVSGINPTKFQEDSKLWKKRVDYYKSKIGELGKKGRYRNLLDMNSGLGGFAASLTDDPIWVMNIMPTATVDTLGVVYERGLIGTYQDWCESMSTYPRTYDFIHANAVFSLYKGRCDLEYILLEMDRILRPEGSVIFRDDVDILVKIKSLAQGMRWDAQFVDHEDGPLEREKILIAVKKRWKLPKPTQT